MTPDLEALLHALEASGLRFVVIGGVAVGVHGYVRATKISPSAPREDLANLEVLATLLRELDGEQLEVGDLDADELPFDLGGSAIRVCSLAHLRLMKRAAQARPGPDLPRRSGALVPGARGVTIPSALVQQPQVHGGVGVTSSAAASKCAAAAGRSPCSSAASPASRLIGRRGWSGGPRDVASPANERS